MTWWPWTHAKLFANPWSSPMYSPRRALFLRPVRPLRPLVVLVDAALVSEAAHDGSAKYLLELVTEPAISAHLYATDGPPSGAQRVTATATGVEGVAGWVTTRPRPDGTALEVVRLVDGVPTLAQVRTDDPVFRRLVTIPAVAEAGVGEPTANPAEDATALMAAKAVKADLFVARRALGAEPKSGYWWTTTVLSPEDAVPVIGLYLRTQGRFVLARSPSLGQPPKGPQLYERDRATFYWLAARHLLPSAIGLSVACDAYGSRTGDETLVGLPKALQWRIDQVLRARDRLLATLSVPQTVDTMDDALTELDQILLWLMAAFDIAATVAHVAVGVERIKVERALWQWGEWLTKVGESAPQLGALMGDDSKGKHTLAVLRLLRNAVHGEALSAGGRVPTTGPAAMQTLVRLPRRSRDEVLVAMDALGGRGDWGATEGTGGDLYLHPGAFVEALVPRAISLLDALLAATPLDRLWREQAADDPRDWITGRAVGEIRTRAQLGLRSDLLTGLPSLGADV